MKMNLTVALLALAFAGCDERRPSTDEQQSRQQAAALEQAHAQVGMPSVTHFAEKRMMKDLYELRDGSSPTHTYLVNEQVGCLRYLGASIGYGLPYATQYTAPTRTVTGYQTYHEKPQAEPNGLFMPTAAEGTWVMLKDPKGTEVKAVYVEPRVLVSPFRLPEQECPPIGKTVEVPETVIRK
jgi:hypothetical protein